ncbi:MAG: DUF5615 family PIN-like protein [Roseiflexus sp.]|nr:DUF5615 family PIN-like protein [Roseiflexus sp.]
MSARASARSAFINAFHVGDIGYATAEDATILQLARNEQRVVVTLGAVLMQSWRGGL